jgi:ribosomal protein S18 acetylase RimI-like enzyme
MSLIKTIENNFSATGQYWGNLNSSFWKIRSIKAMKTGIDSADLNWVWNTNPLTVKDAVCIQKIKLDYAKAALPLWWWVFPQGQSKTTKDILSDNGFTQVETMPGMAVALNKPSTKLSPHEDLQIMLVQDKTTLLLWEAVSFQGFAMKPETTTQYHRFVTSFNLSPNTPQKIFLAYWQGKAVATSLLFLHENTGGIYFVSTLEQYRRQGIGLALTQATMQYAKKMDFKFCTLQAESAGVRVYQQAGFKEYCRADVYQLSNVYN